jgi:superfamily II DNA or RNA helicase
MDAEKIARPSIHIWPIDRPGNIENYKWQGAETHGIVNNKYRNRVIAELCAKDKDAQILILVKRIDQGKHLEELIPNSHFLHGENKTADRQDIVKRFESGESFVLIASTIFDEGIDIKNVSHVVIAGGGASFIKALQRVGRGTRITDKKKEVDIYDFWDDTNPTLLRHSRERVKIYKKYGFEQIEFHPDTEVKKLLL